MSQYIPMGNPGPYGSVTAANFGQFNNQGYSTSPYANAYMPSMSTAQAAWISATTSAYKSPYSGLTNLEYMEQVRQRSQMFWDQAAIKGANAVAYGTGFLYFNAGSAFQSVGKLLGGKTGGALEAFGNSGEWGMAPRLLWHNGVKRFTNAFADSLSEPIGQGMSRAAGSFMNKIADWRGLSGTAREAFIDAPKNTMAGYFNSMAGGSLETMAETFAGKAPVSLTAKGPIFPNAEEAARFGVKEFKGNLFSNAAAYTKKHGVLAGAAKSGARIMGGLASTMGYFMATGAALDFAIGGTENLLTAGNFEQQESALNFQAMKGKIFDSRGQDNAKVYAQEIAKAIKEQVVQETGIKGSVNRFLFGHQLGEGIEKKSSMYSLFAQYGLTGKSSNADEFLSKARQLEKAVESLSKTFGKTASQAVDMIRVMKSQGIKDANLIKAGKSLQLTSDISGYSAEQVMSIQSHGSEAMRGTMFSSELGVGLANQVMRRTAIASEMDESWNKALYTFRGKDSANVLLTKTMGDLARSRDVQGMFVASMFKNAGRGYEYTGKVDYNALNNAISGSGSFITDRDTQAMLISRFENLTTAQQNQASIQIQRATKQVGASGMMKLIGSSYTANGFNSAEAGLVAELINRGVPPEEAAAAAKAMTRNVDNRMMAQNFKADAIRALNTQVGRGKTSITDSIFGQIGSNFNLGVAGSLLKLAGSASTGLFGRQAGAVEVAGGMALAGRAFLPTVASTINPLALTAGAVLSAYANRDTIGRAMGQAFGLGNTAFNSTMAGMVPAALTLGGATMAHGAVMSGGLGIGGTLGAGIGGYMGYGAGQSIVNPIANLVYGQDARSLRRDRAGSAAFLHGTFGAAGAGLGTIGGAMVMGVTATAAAPFALAAATIGAGYGLYNYADLKRKEEIEDRKQLIMDTARTVGDLDLLEGTDLLNQAASSYIEDARGLAKIADFKPSTTMDRQTRRKLQTFMLNTSHELIYDSTRRATTTSKKDKDSWWYKNWYSVRAYHAVTNKLIDMTKYVAKNTTMDDRDVRMFQVQRYLNQGIRDFYSDGKGYEGNVVEEIMSRSGKNTIKLKGSKDFRKHLRGVQEMYEYGSDDVKQAILDNFKSFKGTIVDEAGNEFSSINNFLRKSSLASKMTDPEQIQEEMTVVNSMLKFDDSKMDNLTVAEASSAAYVFNSYFNMSARERENFLAQTTSAKDARRHMAKKIGWSEKRLYEVVLSQKGMDDKTRMIAAGRLAKASYGAKMQMVESRISDVVLQQLGSKAGTRLSGVLKQVTSSGQLTDEGAKTIREIIANEEAAGRQSPFLKQLGQMVNFREQFLEQAAAWTGNENQSYTWKEYREKFKDSKRISGQLFISAAGDDGKLSKKELEKFVGDRYITNKLPQLLMQQQTLDPVTTVKGIGNDVNIIKQVLQASLGQGKVVSPEGVMERAMPTPDTAKIGGQPTDNTNKTSGNNQRFSIRN